MIFVFCSKRYDEAFEVYLSENNECCTPFDAKSQTSLLFQLEDGRQRDVTNYLRAIGLDAKLEELLTICKKNLEGRESAKFVFSKTLSDILIDLSNFRASFDNHDQDFPYDNPFDQRCLLP